MRTCVGLEKEICDSIDFVRSHAAQEENQT